MFLFFSFISVHCQSCNFLQWSVLMALETSVFYTLPLAWPPPPTPPSFQCIHINVETLWQSAGLWHRRLWVSLTRASSWQMLPVHPAVSAWVLDAGQGRLGSKERGGLRASYDALCSILGCTFNTMQFSANCIINFFGLERHPGVLKVGLPFFVNETREAKPAQQSLWLYF